jgi:hypothetical protein
MYIRLHLVQLLRFRILFDKHISAAYILGILDCMFINYDIYYWLPIPAIVRWMMFQFKTLPHPGISKNESSSSSSWKTEFFLHKMFFAVFDTSLIKPTGLHNVWLSSRMCMVAKLLISVSTVIDIYKIKTTTVWLTKSGEQIFTKEGFIVFSAVLLNVVLPSHLLVTITNANRALELIDCL